MSDANHMKASEIKGINQPPGKVGEMQDADKLRASAIEAATCDRFGNPVLSLGPKTTVGRALAAQEDFQQNRLPAFARFRDAERLSRSASQNASYGTDEGNKPVLQRPAQGLSWCCRFKVNSTSAKIAGIIDAKIFPLGNTYYTEGQFWDVVIS